MSQDERREFHRVFFQVPVVLNCGGDDMHTPLIDISLKGALVQVPPGFECATGTLCRLVIPLTEGGEEHIAMTVRLAHREGEHLGFAWQDIDVESFSHLRRLLELNLGDADMVNRELSALGG